MSEIKHTILEEGLARLLWAESVSLKEALLSIGIAVEQPPRATVTREEFECAALNGWEKNSYSVLREFLSDLNIRVTP